MQFVTMTDGARRSVRVDGDWDEEITIDQNFLAQADRAHVKMIIEFAVDNGSGIYEVERWDEERRVFIAQLVSGMKIDPAPESVG